MSSFVSQKEAIVEKMEIQSLNDEEIKEESYKPSGSMEVITTDEVYDGFQAIIKYQESISRPRCCQNSGYSLIVMDYNMPEINGLEATQQILEIQEDMTPNPDNEVSIVGLTANSGIQMKLECL